MANTAVKKSEPKMSRALVRQETIAGYLFLLPSQPGRLQPSATEKRQRR